jgi:hypothetical protein
MTTLNEVKKRLPGFAKGLAISAVTVAEIHQIVRRELNACLKGENPLTSKQYVSLEKFLRKTGGAR